MFLFSFGWSIVDILLPNHQNDFFMQVESILLETAYSIYKSTYNFSLLQLWRSIESWKLLIVMLQNLDSDLLLRSGLEMFDFFHLLSVVCTLFGLIYRHYYHKHSEMNRNKMQKISHYFELAINLLPFVEIDIKCAENVLKPIHKMGTSFSLSVRTETASTKMLFNETDSFKSQTF